MTDESASKLVQGQLIKRYKRFLADVRLVSGEGKGKIITAHCPNTGSMKNCIEEGADVWLSLSDNPARKHRHTWELIRTRRGHYIGINTHRANHLVYEGLCKGLVGQLKGYQNIRRELAYGQEKSRIDFFLSDHPRLADAYVEVKSVTLLEPPVTKGVGYFPDAVSERGTKHLRELAEVARQGERALLLFCVQHTGIREVRPADHIDERYGQMLRQAVAAGVEVCAWKIRMHGKRPQLHREVPVNLDEVPHEKQ